MTNHYEEFERRYADIIAGLRRLGQQIDAENYPGQAWPRPRRPVQRLTWPIAAGVAAAAALIIFAIIAGKPPAPQPPSQAVSQAPTAPPELAATAAIFNLAVPADIDLADVGQVNLRIPTFSMPSLAEIWPTAAFDWDVPTVSIPLLQYERSNNHDS